MPAGPPEIPKELSGYNSYVVDPRWARQYTSVWAAVMAFVVVLSLPNIIRTRPWRNIFGIAEYRQGAYRPRLKWRPLALHRILAIFRWSLPGINISIGQTLLIIAYFAVYLSHVLKDTAPLVKNANRAGFMALAQLSPVFLLASKASPLSLLIPHELSYTTVNFLHRWIGRILYLSALLHGTMWINNHIKFNQPIIGEFKEECGIAAFSVLSILVLSSLEPVRRLSYQFFYYIHMLTFPAFFIVICYHTPYAFPWVFPPVAIFAWDYALRFVRTRVKEAHLVAKGPGLTLIRISDCVSGWTPGQHIRLRVLFGGRHLFETHPFTIMTVPSPQGNAKESEIILGARVIGDWTKALNAYALDESSRVATEKSEEVAVPVYVTIDGPYGGLKLPRPLEDYDNVLIFAGGSGATFCIGALEGLYSSLTASARSGSTKRRIEFIWCLRSYATIRWFSDQLSSLSNRLIDQGIDLHITVYVTCLCDPEAIPDVANMDVILKGCRPEVGPVVKGMVGGQNLAVLAAGPRSLTREVGNTVASLSLTQGTEIGFHGEAYEI